MDFLMGFIMGYLTATLGGLIAVALWYLVKVGKE